jgi:metallo-beta-lactamase family protein
VLFLGYQAEGTPVREIQRNDPQQGTVPLNGERNRMCSGVQSIEAHADQGRGGCAL